MNYKHAHPGDLLHLDIKRRVKIAKPSHRVTGERQDTVKGIGAEYVHVAILACPERSRRNHIRIAFSVIYPDQTRSSVLHFLDTALAYYARLGIHFKAVLTEPTKGGPTAPTPSSTPANNSVSNTAAPGPTPAHQRQS